MTEYTKSKELQLLELAGKALALSHAMYYEACPDDGFPMPYAKLGKSHYWNPYCDDGDSMRGAVLKGLNLHTEQEPAGTAYCTDHAGHLYPSAYAEVGANRVAAYYEAARRAIVLALAEIGASLASADLVEADAAPEPDRKDFEDKCLVLAVKHYGYEPGDALLKSILERRANDRYMLPWVDGAWIGYQAAIEPVSVITIDQPTLDRMYERTKALIDAGEPRFMVVLPRPFMSGYTESGNCPATDLYSFDDVKSAIEAAGGTVTK